MNQILDIPGAALDERWPPVETLLPHRGTMLLVDALHGADDTSVSVGAHVDRNGWYADADGNMPAWIGIELMAQAIAVHVGVLSLRAGEPARPGVLLGSHTYTAHVDAFAADAPLDISATELLRSAQGHGAYECAIRQRGTLCAQAVIKVYQPADFQSFIEESFQS